MSSYNCARAVLGRRLHRPNPRGTNAASFVVVLCVRGRYVHRNKIQSHSETQGMRKKCSARAFVSTPACATTIFGGDPPQFQFSKTSISSGARREEEEGESEERTSVRSSYSFPFSHFLGGPPTPQTKSEKTPKAGFFFPPRPISRQVKVSHDHAQEEEEKAQSMMPRQDNSIL